MKKKIEQQEDHGLGEEIFTKYLRKVRKIFNCSIVWPPQTEPGSPCPEFLNVSRSVTKEDDHDVELHKAAAQAWYGHYDTSATANEFDFSKLNLKKKPSRFKIEAMNKPLNKTREKARWNFSESLWDSYEISSISKQLESVLGSDHQFSECDYKKRRKESSSSLRSLFNTMSSRRFQDEAWDEND